MTDATRSDALAAAADRAPDRQGDSDVAMLTGDDGALVIYHDQRAFPQGEWLSDATGGVDLQGWR
jgi:hypothetical protein